LLEAAATNLWFRDKDRVHQMNQLRWLGEVSAEDWREIDELQSIDPAPSAI
jgi:hypothetical protein